MMLGDLAQEIIEFVRASRGWELPVVAGLAFGESLAVVGLFVPATVALIGIGALMGASGVDFAPVWVAAAVGAVAGDWVSYWFGFRFKAALADMWPLSRYPDLIPRGEDFVRRFGIGAVFIGRFFGPARGAGRGDARRRRVGNAALAVSARQCPFGVYLGGRFAGARNGGGALAAVRARHP